MPLIAARSPARIDRLVDWRAKSRVNSSNRSLSNLDPLSQAAPDTPPGFETRVSV
jgi:hypothetical protein